MSTVFEKLRQVFMPANAPEPEAETYELFSVAGLSGAAPEPKPEEFDDVTE